jgi:hypothetical protein
MNVMTRDGIRIYVLPDVAECALTGKSPLEMDKCPIMNFDDTGDICVPEMCTSYTEDSRKKRCGTCRHDLGGGYDNCRLNLESECAAGNFEAWESKDNA